MKYLIVIFFTFISQNALAECSGVDCKNVKLEMLYVQGSNSYIQTSGTETLLDNCVPLGGNLISLDHSHSAADKIYALLLTAYTSKLNVKIRTNDTTNNTGSCSIAYAVLENN